MASREEGRSRLGCIAGLKRASLRLFAVLSLMTAVTPAHAARPFSAAVSGYFTGGCYFLSFPVYWPSAEWIVAGVSHTFPSWTDEIHSIDSTDGESVFALIRPPDTYTGGLRIDRIVFDASPMNNSRTTFFNGLPDHYATGFAVARNGRVFAAVNLNGAPNSEIAVISSNGTLHHLLAADGYVSNMAVAGDNCTIFYPRANVIRRLNACTGASLPDFTTLHDHVTDVAPLANGDVLATTWQTLQRFNPDGSLARTFTLRRESDHSLDAVGVSPDDATVVVADMGYCDRRGWIIALSLADGHELWRQETDSISHATSVVVEREPLPVPILSNAMIAAMAVTLAAAGFLLMRR